MKGWSEKHLSCAGKEILLFFSKNEKSLARYSIKKKNELQGTSPGGQAEKITKKAQTKTNPERKDKGQN